MLIINITDRDRSEQLKALQDGNVSLAVYTDRSGEDKKIGVAAVMMNNRRELSSLWYHLRPETEHMVYEVEVTMVIFRCVLVETAQKCENPVFQWCGGLSRRP